MKVVAPGAFHTAGDLSPKPSFWFCFTSSVENSCLHHSESYVIARVDDSEIKGLAQAKLWVDFSQQREGPSRMLTLKGRWAFVDCRDPLTSMLSLLYGLKGEPLPPGAVKMAAKVDDEMREGLLGIKACRGIGDAAGLVALAETDNMAWKGSPMLMCAAAEGLIAMGKIPEAIAVLDRAEEAFPKAVRPKQLRGLALPAAERRGRRSSCWAGLRRR
jgi:hypothetical protein